MLRTCCLGLVLAFCTVAQAESKIDSSTFGDLQARAIGPAVMGGRVAAIDAVKEDNRLTVYVGAAGGGVWKSVNGGTTFKPVFDEYTQSIGAIAIDRKNPKTVWVGTGESWTRNSVSVGTGVYRTTDAGENWEYVGLKDSERIVKILLHPADSNTIWVCVTGHLWNANEERGVFKSTDGGKTWKKTLYVDENTGCSDLAIDPQEPQHLYAGMWQFRRYPWTFDSGGPGSGLYRSDDGGDTWQRSQSGLPEGTLGRIAVAVAPSRPNVVYANVESEKTAMYRSEDLGKTWAWVGSTMSVEARPFYFSLVVVDPKDHNKVYKPATMTSVSRDGGKTWSGVGGGTHPDHHAFWINPDNVDHLMLGTDGGLYISYDGGASWNFKQSLPVSQFYHVTYDMQDPYNVYGGLQDNGSWMGPSRTPSGIQNKDWDNVGFGDGFQVQVDRADPDFIYVESQGGRIQRVKKSTGETKDIQPLPGEGEPKYRFNWNTPIQVSPTRTDTVYIGGQFLFRTRNRGESWEKISPDLTTNDPEKQKQLDSGGLTPDNSDAENHCTVYTIAESTKSENLIWAGTDDGNLQITRDGGKKWTNVVNNVPNLPASMWVSYVDASVHDEGTAFATFDGHNTGDMKPYVYRTTDFGATWTALATGDIEGYCHSVRQDIVNPNLIFLGTEFGLYISIDGGATWARFKEKLPKVAVRDIAIHPRENDLILATHGRGVVIIDDLTPLRQLTAEKLDADVVMLPGKTSTLLMPAGAQEFSGDDQFVGSNPTAGGLITYYLKRRHMFGDLNIEILDQAGKTIATVPGGKRRGINRVGWNARMKAPKVAPAASLVPEQWSFFGPQVAAGSYKVRMVKGKDTYDSKLELRMDPRAKYSPEDMALQDSVVTQLYRMVERLTYVVDALVDLQEQAKARIAKAGEGSDAAKALQAFNDDLEAFRKTLVATRKGGFIAGEEQLREHITSLYGAVNGYEGRPTESQTQRMRALEIELVAAEAKLEAKTEPLAKLNVALQQAKLDPIKRLSKDEWEKKQQG